jgi:hypothetical protein
LLLPAGCLKEAGPELRPAFVAVADAVLERLTLLRAAQRPLGLIAGRADQPLTCPSV